MTLCYKLLGRPGNVREVIKEAEKSFFPTVISIGRYPNWVYIIDGPSEDQTHYLRVSVNGKSLNLMREIQLYKSDNSQREYMERKAEQLSRILKRRGSEAIILDLYKRDIEHGLGL